MGSGDWDWPIKSTVRVTNSYGINCYQYAYNLGREGHAVARLVEVINLKNNPVDIEVTEKFDDTQVGIGGGLFVIFDFLRFQAKFVSLFLVLVILYF